MIELTGSHLLKLILSKVLLHGPDNFIGLFWMGCQLGIDEVLSSIVGKACHLCFQLAESSETTSGRNIHMATHYLLVEGVISLTVFILVSQNPLHGGFVSEGVGRNSEESISHSNACRLVKVLRGVQNISFSIICTQIIFAERADRFCMLWVHDHCAGDEGSRLNLATNHASMLTLHNIVNLADHILLSEFTSTHRS